MSARRDLTGQLGRYRLVQKLGAGGMGAVYLAEDTQMGRQVALKVPHFDARTKPAIVERFQREARIAASIDHPNLCAVHDVGEINGVHYFTMPFIQGKTLSSQIDGDKPWPAAQAAGLVRKVGMAVAKLHEKGIVHRDLKPSNIMVRDGGEPVLMDFGLARSFTADSQRLTTTGAPLGSPAYMSPEQVAGARDFGPPTDVYGLGVIFYELITGHVPFSGPLLALYGQILTTPAPPPSQRCASVDPRFDVVCARALAKKPEERYADTHALTAALAEALRELNQTATARETRQPEVARLTCPHCRSTMKVTADFVGRKVKCPECQTNLGRVSETLLRPPRSPFDQTTVIGLPPEATVVAEQRGSARSSKWLVAVLAVALLTVSGIAFLGGSGKERRDEGVPTYKPTPTPVTTRQPSLEVLALPATVLDPGQSTTIPVRVRRVNCPEAVSIKPDEPQPGLTVLGVVAAGENEGSLSVTVDATAGAGERRVLLRFQAGDTVAETSWTLTIRSVSAPPPALALAPLLPLTLKRGESKTIPVRITRTNCPGPIVLELATPSEGIVLRNGLVRSGETLGSVEVAATTGALAGRRSLRLRAHGTVNAEANLTVTVETPANPTTYTVDLDGVKLEFVRVGKGTFWMGSPENETDRAKEFEEQKEVTIAEDFYIGKYEVTQAQWQAVMGNNPSYFSRTGDGKDAVKDLKEDKLKQLPVEYVSWNDAQGFLRKLNDREKDRNSGWLYRLPREVEWEYSCRGGPFSSGEGKQTAPFYFAKPSFSLSFKDANFNSRYPYGNASKAESHLQRTCTVGSYQANPLGIYDLHGNVWEWCDDLFREGPVRVIRGGSWGNDGLSCRAAFRLGYAPDNRFQYNGLRAARVPSSK